MCRQGGVLNSEDDLPWSTTQPNRSGDATAASPSACHLLVLGSTAAPQRSERGGPVSVLVSALTAPSLAASVHSVRENTARLLSALQGAPSVNLNNTCWKANDLKIDLQMCINEYK
jgi:hypothetical protein